MAMEVEIGSVGEAKKGRGTEREGKAEWDQWKPPDRDFQKTRRILGPRGKDNK